MITIYQLDSSFGEDHVSGLSEYEIVETREEAIGMIVESIDEDGMQHLFVEMELTPEETQMIKAANDRAWARMR